jgi:hypothetical protein
MIAAFLSALLAAQPSPDMAPIDVHYQALPAFRVYTTCFSERFSADPRSRGDDAAAIRHANADALAGCRQVRDEQLAIALRAATDYRLYGGSRVRTEAAVRAAFERFGTDIGVETGSEAAEQGMKPDEFSTSANEALLIDDSDFPPAPGSVPSSSEEVIVIGERLKNWRGRIGDMSEAPVRCRTTRSTGDVDVDRIGCEAMVACFSQMRERIVAIGDRRLPMATRNALRASVEHDLGACVEERRDSLVEELAERRFQARQGD